VESSGILHCFQADEMLRGIDEVCRAVETRLCDTVGHALPTFLSGAIS